MNDPLPAPAPTKSYGNPVAATLNGIFDLFRKKERIGELTPEDRLDGKVCLVTGATSGLGMATAVELARRGGHVILACRSGFPQAGETVKRLSGSDKIEMVRLDLADLDSVRACCNALRERGGTLDRVVLNAGIVPRHPQRTKQGFEMMFGVHFVGNALLLSRLLADGVIPNAGFAGTPTAPQTDLPRIVFVASETHRSGSPIKFETLGQPVDYTAMNSMAQYGHSKLVMLAWLSELDRRLNSGGRTNVAVHALCPGPINSNIARDAPGFIKPLLGAVMGALFASPQKACEPVVYLSAARSIEGHTGLYLHLMTRKSPAPQALEVELGRELWIRAEYLIQTGLIQTGPPEKP